MIKLMKYIKEPWRIVVAFDRHIASIVPDKLFLKCLYRCMLNKKLNLNNPKSYTEKLQWLKLYDRNPYYKSLTDKVLVREEVSKLIGEEYLIKELGVFDSVEDIDFTKLPNQFVLKCSHDSGSVIICRDKSKLNIAKTKEKLSLALKCDFGRRGRETAYNSIKKVRPRIVCEEYIYGDEDISDIPDFKFFCFDGEVKVFQLNIGRNSKEGVKVNFYDMNKNKIEMHEKGYLSKEDICLPDNIDEMIFLAGKLSKGIPHVRVDLMAYKNKIYFSEFTFYHCGGFAPFEPDEADVVIGDYIKLPEKKLNNSGR